MSIKLFSTTPSPKDIFWQIVIVPTITILRNSETEGPYTVFSVEWLFWSLTFVINDPKRPTAERVC
jgi:hypothetical protein